MKIKATLDVLFLCSFIIIINSCNKTPVVTLSTFKGNEVAMGNGKANSFFTLDDNDRPKEIGIEMTTSALMGLTQDPLNFANSTFLLPLDAKAQELTAFDHIVINWNPQGHPPAGVYNVPHFDFHFYTITVAEQSSITPYTPATAAKFDLLPPAGYMPDTYFPDGGGVPGMGKHWGEANLPATFTNTMIYGSYNGKVNFVEPMITMEVLQSGLKYSVPYAQPRLFAKADAWYPTKYNIYRDNFAEKIYVTLTGFVKR